ncbi:MAG: polysulfide reductase NrfD, partial [Chloroflexi bacterium]|nr:polysulfide reductase NrfD [Chloroflexota bacterium]
SDLGRPERFYLAALRPHTSWESRGTLIVGAFGLLGLLHVASWLVAGSAWDGILAAPLALLALAILVYGGLLLHSLRAFALWTPPWQVGLYVTSGLLAGSGVLALDPAGSLSPAQLRALAQAGGLLAALAALLLAGLLAWARGHSATSRASAQELLAGSLAGHLWVGVVGIGLAVPLLAGVAATLGPLAPELARPAGAAALAGVLPLRYAILAAARRPTELTFRGLGPWGAAAAGR